MRGDLDDLDALRRGAADADAVIHLANKHDWNNPAESNRAERAAVQTIGEALAGSDRPFLLAVGRGRPHPGPAGHRGGPVARPRTGLATRREREPRARLRRPRGPHDERSGSPPPSTACATTGSSRHRRRRPRHGRLRLIRRRIRGWSAVHRSDAARLVAPRPREGARRSPPARRRRGGDTHPGDRGGHRRGARRARHLGRPRGRHEHFGWIGRFFAHGHVSDEHGPASSSTGPRPDRP